MSKNAFSESLILKKFGKVADVITRGFSGSFLGRALTAYDAERKDADRGIVASAVTRLFGFVKIGKMRSAIMRGFDSSPILAFIKRLNVRLLTLRMRQYGVMTFTFGLFSVLMYILGVYAFSEAYVGSEISFAVGVIAVLISLPFMLSKKTLFECVSTGVFSKRIFEGLLGLRLEIDDNDIRHYGRSEIAFISGTLLGLSTFFVKVPVLLLSLLLILVICLVLNSPEGGLMLLVIGAPFVQVRYLAYFSMFAIFSYLLKALRGKRSFKIEFCDAAVLLYVIVVLFGGIFSVRPSVSFTYSVKLVSFILLYIVCVNVIVSGKWIKRMRNAFIFSCVSCVVIEIAQKFALLSTHFLFESSIASGQMTALFESPEQLSQMIVLCGFFAFSSFVRADNGLRRIFAFILICAEVYCLFATLSVLSVISFVIAFAVFLLLYSNKNIFTVLFFCVLAPVVDYIIPATWRSSLTVLKEAGSAQITQRLPVWRAALRMSTDHFLGGVGKGVFYVIYPGYVTERTANVSSAENVYLQEIIDTGIFGLAVFVICMVLFIQSCLKLNKLSTGSSMTDPDSGLCGIIGLLVLGLVSNIWQSDSIFLMFWMVMGYTAACRRSGLLHLRKHIGFEKGGTSYDL